MKRTVVRLAELPQSDVIDLYEQLLRPVFRADELLSFEDLVATYRGDDAEPSGVVLDQGRPIAVLLAERYVDSRVLLLSYLSVVEDVRGQGVGSLLLDELMERRRSDAPDQIAIAEIDDPRVWPGDARTGDARARLRFYERRRARLVPVTYFQPSLRESDHRVPGMFLIRLDEVTDAAKDTLGRFLVEYFSVCEGPEALADPAVIKLLRQVEALDASLALPPLSEWQSMPSLPQ